MKTPDFWAANQGGVKAVFAMPISLVYKYFSEKRARQMPSWKAPIPVICIGNLTLGGAGKTPTAQALGRLIKDKLSKNPIYLSRGYGGTIQKTVILTDESADEAGDEPLLLKQVAPVCISPDRTKGAKVCAENHYDVIIMDDGFQNPTLYKDLNILVIEGAYGLGNQHIFPAGPLRESLENALKRTDCVLIIGDDLHKISDQILTLKPDQLIVFASQNARSGHELAGQPVLAFAGLARPEKFFETLNGLGARIVKKISYPDHYAYKTNDLEDLVEQSVQLGLKLVCTEKDWVKLPSEFQKKVSVVKIELLWQKEEHVIDKLKQLF